MSKHLPQCERNDGENESHPVDRPGDVEIGPRDAGIENETPNHIEDRRRNGLCEEAPANVVETFVSIRSKGLSQPDVSVQHTDLIHDVQGHGSEEDAKENLHRAKPLRRLQRENSHVQTR